LESTVVVCPVAIAVGCKKCPVVSVCPLKSSLGDFKEDKPAPPPAPAAKKGSGKRG
jgi:hypothetical protein